MRASTWLHKISKVPTRDVVPLSSLTYHPRYSGTRKLDLSRTFNSVDEQNRFLPLELLLHQFSGHVGRRQYKMMCDLSVHLDHLKKIGMDWHDMKYLTRDELMDLFNKELQLSHSEKAILLTMLQAKLCGVLRRSSNQRHSTTVCMNHGVAEHGWRCGRHGHTNDVYFEGKQKANPAVLQLAHRSAHRMAVRDGVRVDVRSEPDFRVVGRFHHETNRRVWSSPQNPLFHVSAIGFEFRVHPQDPRARAQIEEAAPLWEMHASVVQQVVWEMLELHASERSTQPLDLQPNEMGAPDNPHAFTSAFTSSVRQEGKEVDDVVETRMISTSGKEQPWFRAPLPQSFEDGVPTILPYAPTIIIRATFRSIPRYATQEDVTTQLMQPVMDVSCLVHPSACFWWNAEAEATCVESILDYAKRTPYAIPFNLYLRVDLAKDERSSEEWPAEMERRRSAHAHHFDLRHFCSNHSSSTTN